jgi:integrase
MADDRTLEKTSEPGVYRRHANGCKRNGRCKCPYVVVWRDRGRQRKQMFPTFELAREHRGKMASGTTQRQPLSSVTVADYYEAWLPNYRGRTARGFEDSTRREYEISFRLHILPLRIAGMRMRDLTAKEVREWLKDLERRGASPTVIRKAKVAFSAMLACAVEDDDLGSNPATGVRYIPTEQAKHEHPAIKRRKLAAADVVAILNAAPEQWRVFFMLLAQSGVRIGELLGLTWGNVSLGDDAHIMVVEQIYRGRRKRLKTDASMARVPLSATMASWLSELRPADADTDAPVFPSATGTALNYANVYNRVLRPALIDAGLAVKVGENANGEPVWDYQGIAFHAFRKACGSLLLHHGKTLKQVQGWLRHSRLSTTMDVYIQQVDDGLGGADAWDDILPGWGNSGATPQPETAPNGTLAETPERRRRAKSPSRSTRA